jgi:hypothetical protein
MFRSLLGNLGEIRELPGTSLIAQFNVPWTSLGENSADWEHKIYIYIPPKYNLNSTDFITSEVEIYIFTYFSDAYLPVKS